MWKYATMRPIIIFSCIVFVISAGPSWSQDPDAYNESLDLFRKGDYAAALPKMEDCARKNPDSFAPWVDMASMHAMLKNFEQAIFCIDRAKALGAPKADDQRKNILDMQIAPIEERGLAKVRQNPPDSQGAISDYQIALKIAPHNARLYSLLGAAYYQMSNYQKGKEAFQHAEKLDPKHYPYPFQEKELDNNNDLKFRAEFQK